MIVGIEALDQMSNIIVTFGRIKFEATVIATLKGWRFLGTISMESITGHCAGLLLTGLIVPIVQYAFKQHSRERKLAAFFWQVRVLTDSNKSQKAHPGGFEPPTLGSEGQIRIVQLDVSLLSQIVVKQGLLSDCKKQTLFARLPDFTGFSDDYQQFSDNSRTDCWNGDRNSLWGRHLDANNLLSVCAKTRINAFGYASSFNQDTSFFCICLAMHLF